MKLRNHRGPLRRRWVDVVIVTLSTTAVVAAIMLLMPSQYTATTRVFINDEHGASYTQVATSPLVLQPVIERLGLDATSTKLAEHVSAVTTPGAVLEISVDDPSAAGAAELADAIGAQVVAIVGELSPERADGSKAAKATILAPALVPTTPSAPDTPRNLVLGLLAGIVLGCCAGVVHHLADTRVRSSDDVAAITGRPVLGAVGFDSDLEDHPVIVCDRPTSATAKAIRRIQADLQLTSFSRPSASVMVTSAATREGTSTIALNLAAALADTGSHVVLVDADVRRPSVADSLGLEGAVGLTTVLTGRADFADVVQPWRDSSLDILPAGRIPPDPSGLLVSDSMQRLVADLTSRYEVVVLDAPPLLAFPDAVALARLADGCLLVVGMDRGRRSQLHKAVTTLATSGTHLHGTVITRAVRGAVRRRIENSGSAGARKGVEVPVRVGTPAPESQAAVPKRARVESPAAVKVESPPLAGSSTASRPGGQVDMDLTFIN